MAMTPDQYTKVGLGIAPSPSPFLTPRPERRQFRGSERFSIPRPDRDREVNVQVVLRCRPLSDEEQKMNIPNVISCNESKREVSVLQSLANKQVDKVFTFDKVFGPKAQQRSIYDRAICPIVEEVMNGFNCTVFAYGQTGTGKTYTMEGSKGGNMPADAGIIPRAVRQIFDTLEAQNADYSLKVTFFELYNEEITDLLVLEDASKDDKLKKPISLMEDSKGCVVIRGLEEESVYSANEIYSLLERGAAKRRTANTFLNKHSSRSHAIFSISVLVREAAAGDEELIKCGKLSLVDLAGSEGISRSGLREEWARETGEINKSLLTLGRVINALAEHSAHVPYRDSKLTRLLRDSLGGKTKTCIIATISPAVHSLEETLCTLDYAYRAKNIKNRPEANQKLSKALLLKDLCMKLERMKEDVRAAREKNGIYISHERYEQDENEKKDMVEKVKLLENDLASREKEIDRMRELYASAHQKKLHFESELKQCKMTLEKKAEELQEVKENHKQAIMLLNEKEDFISNLLCSESTLIQKAKELRTDLQSLSDDNTSLFAKLDKKEEIEAKNHGIVSAFGSQLDSNLHELRSVILSSFSQQQHQLKSMEEHLQAFLDGKSDATKVMESKIKNISDTYSNGIAFMKELIDTMQKKGNSDMDIMSNSMSSQAMAAAQLATVMETNAKEIIDDVQNSLAHQKMLLSLLTTQREEGLRCNMKAAKEISEASLVLLQDLQNKAVEVMKAINGSLATRSLQLAEFEKTFKDQAAKETEEALNAISSVVKDLVSKRISMVSESSKNIKESFLHDHEHLSRDVSSMERVSLKATEELHEYTETLHRHFVQDMFSVAESRVVMDNAIDECSSQVDHSRNHWETSKLQLNSLSKKNAGRSAFMIKEYIRANHIAHEELRSMLSTFDLDFNSTISSATVSVEDALTQDKMVKTKMDSTIALCLKQLKKTQESHNENIAHIRTAADKNLARDYLVEQRICTTPHKKNIVVPSVDSIENLRTPTPASRKYRIEESILETSPKYSLSEGQNILHLPNRSPFGDVN